MKPRIEHPICSQCDPERRHPEGAPHLINGAYFEEAATGLLPLQVYEAKAEHRRASVKAAVRRLRQKRAQSQEQTSQAA